MDIYATHAAGIAYLQTEMGTSCPVFTWGGHEHRALAGGATNSKTLGAGGFGLEADVAFECLAADFGTLPAVKQTLVYSGKTYRIEAVRVRPGGKQFRLECLEAARNL